MSNSHGRKYLFNVLAGLFLVAAGISSLGYSSFNRPKEDWLIWTIGCTIVTIIGLLFLANGIVHKVKADLIRRQKQKSRSDRTDPQ